MRLLGGETSFNPIRRVDGHGSPHVARSSEGIHVDVQLITLGNGLLHRFARGGVFIGLRSVSSRSSPGTLSGSEDAIDHVEPIEEGIEQEHQWVQPCFISAQFGTEVQHQEIVKAQGYGNKTHGQILYPVGRRQDRDDHDKEEEGSRPNGILHKTYQAENRIALPESDVSQHAHFVGDKAEEPPTALLEKTLKRLDCLRLAECTRAHLDLIWLSCTNHEQVRQPSILPQMALPKVKEIFTLLGLVGKVILGHLTEC